MNAEEALARIDDLEVAGLVPITVWTRHAWGYWLASTDSAELSRMTVEGNAREQWHMRRPIAATFFVLPARRPLYLIPRLDEWSPQAGGYGGMWEDHLRKLYGADHVVRMKTPWRGREKGTSRPWEMAQRGYDPCRARRASGLPCLCTPETPR